MRSLAVLALVPVLLLAQAAAPKAKVHGFSLSGTVAQLDERKKTLSVRNAGGKETTLVWTNATSVSGAVVPYGKICTLTPSTHMYTYFLVIVRFEKRSNSSSQTFFSSSEKRLLGLHDTRERGRGRAHAAFQADKTMGPSPLPCLHGLGLQLKIKADNGLGR